MTRKEIVKALRCYGSIENCPVEECNEKCPYWLENDKFDLYGSNAEISDRYQLCRAAADALEQDVHPADMVPKDFHDRCMEMEIEQRISLEGTHKKTVDEICELRDRVENLTLYLQEAFALCPDDLEVMNDWHPGLPGYTPKI